MKTTRHQYQSGNETISYLTAGPTSGPLLVLVHGWPGIAETWKHQIAAFASLGFYVVASDTRGYGQSTVSREVSDYRLEMLVSDQVRLLAHLKREEAVFIGHDWGATIVWSLAAHHPDLCRAVIGLAVPQHTLEYGLSYLISLVNRDIYPEATYPAGQWDYQVFYEKDAKRVTAQMDANPANGIKTVYLKANPAIYGKPAPTANISRDGGRFGGADEAPDLPLSVTVFADDPELHRTVAGAMSSTGFFGATAYYLNHSSNEIYAKNTPTGGSLDMPCLFIEAVHDAICATRLGRLSEPMRRHCRDLTETSIEAAHWLQLEKPEAVNAVITKWIATHVEDWWPGFWQTPLIHRPVKAKKP